MLEAFWSILQFKCMVPLTLGVALGMVVGAVPGLTALMAIAMLTPLTFHFEPETGLCLLLGVLNAAMFGGAISAVLINIPGTPAAIATAIDGYPMARKGEAGVALTLSALGSAGGTLIGMIAFLAIAFPLAEFGLRFGPPEQFAIGVFGLSLVTSLSAGAAFKGFLMAGAGFFLAMVGVDPITGGPRYTMGTNELLEGISLIPLAVGIYGAGEVLWRWSNHGTQEKFLIPPFDRVWPSWAQLVSCAPAFVIGCLSGVVIGVMPALGGDVAALTAWDVARRWSPHPERFGRGAPEGVVAAETANNAVIGGDMACMLALGIPGDPVTAVLIGALSMWGVPPGPLIFQEHPDLIYKIVAILLISTVLSLIMSLVRINTVARLLLRTPLPLLNIVILFSCVFGCYYINRSWFDVGVMSASGLIGFFGKKFGWPLSPLILGFLLSPMMEANLRRTLIMGDGGLSLLATKPIALGFLVLAFAQVHISLRRS